jgi:cell division protein FtsN
MSGRLSTRDYKSPRRGGVDLARWQQFGYGLGMGLLVALLVWIADHRSATRAPEDKPEPRRSATAAVAAAANSADNNSSYDFYQMLPKFEVVVPEKERDVRRVDAQAKIDRPGTYFLQAGSYKGEADAERIRAQLARQDIPANVQRVAVDADVWFRVRIGPIKDLGQLNALRRQLQVADIDSLVIRVDD